MAIECVNTIEILLFQTLESDFEATAKSCVEQLQDYVGCLDYTLTRSTREHGLWWLTGFWESEFQMTRSFESVPMMQLLNCLVEEGARLNFCSFIPQTPEAHGD
jgi:quinol monooxygenase YgiN